MRGLTAQRFTLVELMVAIAIGATLAALAIPHVRDAQLRAKVAEAPMLVNGLADAQDAFAAAHAEYALGLGTPHPAIPPGRQARPWLPEVAPPEFAALEFVPDGAVYGQYTITVWTTAGVDHLAIMGSTDVDEGGPPHFEWARHPLVPSVEPWTRAEICPAAYAPCY